MLYTLFVAAASAYATAYLINKKIISSSSVAAIPETIKSKIVEEMNGYAKNKKYNDEDIDDEDIDDEDTKNSK